MAPLQARQISAIVADVLRELDDDEDDDFVFNTGAFPATASQ